jgi:hypothetical protein
MALLSQRAVSVSSVRACGPAETFHLSVEHYAQLLDRFPDFHGYIEMIAKLRVSNALAKREPLAGRARTRDEFIRRAEEASVEDLFQQYSGMSMPTPVSSSAERADNLAA